MTSAGLPQLPDGPAAAEAHAVRARRAGQRLEWAEPRPLDGPRAWLRLNAGRGGHSVEIARVDPGLAPELQLGAWTEAGWRTRLLRRAFARDLVVRSGQLVAARLGPGALGLLGDLAFWAGVRRACSRAEWRRWTTSYVVLNYHRISDDGKAGQELLEVTPRRFAAQVRWLRRLGYRPLPAATLCAVHHGEAPLPRRGFVVTADDGFADCTEPLRAARVQAQLFVPTMQVGGAALSIWYDEHPAAGWRVDGEPLADWDELRRIEAGGVGVGGHSRRHIALTGLDAAALADELSGSLADLHRELQRPIDVMAYPHGIHDEEVRAAAIDAGWRLAYTTQFGRNGAGTDGWCLRRVPVFRDDGIVTVLWKVVAGEPPPPAMVAAAGRLRSAARLARRPSRAALEDSTAGRRLLRRLAGVDASLAVAVLDALTTAGLEPTLAGGWGVDALLGRQTRPHGDLDVVLPAGTAIAEVTAALAPLRLRLRSVHRAGGVAFSERWVYRDRRGRQVDLLPVGGLPPLDGGYRTTGRIGGRAVPCLDRRAQQAARTGYAWRSEDHEAAPHLDGLDGPAA